jgi:hypothetical protein
MNGLSKLQCLFLSSLIRLVYFFLVRSVGVIHKTTNELIKILALVGIPYLKRDNDFLGETYNGTIVIVKISEVFVNMNSGTLFILVHLLCNF